MFQFLYLPSSLLKFMLGVFHFRFVSGWNGGIFFVSGWNLKEALQQRSGDQTEEAVRNHRDVDGFRKSGEKTTWEK